MAHDRGKLTLTGFESRPLLNSVPEVLRNAISELESRLMDQDSKIATYLSEATKRNSRFSTFERPIFVADNLFQMDYTHVNLNDTTCADCAKGHIVDRPPRADPLVHFGIVASGNQVIKNATERARIHTAHPGALAVEMEAAGLMNIFGCATVRGICDYADSHKNNGWHKYASAIAAAVAKELLGIIPVAMVVAAPSTVIVGSYTIFPLVFIYATSWADIELILHVTSRLYLNEYTCDTNAKEHLLNMPSYSFIRLPCTVSEK